MTPSQLKELFQVLMENAVKWDLQVLQVMKVRWVKRVLMASVVIPVNLVQRVNPGRAMEPLFLESLVPRAKEVRYSHSSSPGIPFN